MIQANIIAVDQRFDFRTGTIKSYAVFELGGKEVRAEVENIDEVKTLISAGLNGAPSPVAPTPDAEPPLVAPPPGVSPTPAEGPPPNPDTLFTDEPPAEDVVEWAVQPDDVISPMMKAALTALEVPPAIPQSVLAQLLGDIIDTFSAEDWKSLGYSVPVQSATPQQVPPQAPPAQPAPKAAPQPAPGQITWADGNPIMPGVTRRARTVQADERGYPIVSSSDVDPGEVVANGDDLDEDGVGSM